MKFVIEIELGSSKMRNPKEVAKAIIDFAAKLYPCGGFTLMNPNIYDIDGNKVGFFDIKDSEDEIST